MMREIGHFAVVSFYNPELTGKGRECFEKLF